MGNIFMIYPVRNNSAGTNFTSWLRPIVHSQRSQESITTEALKERADTLYHIAESSVKEFGHPTRVLGPEGHKNTVEYIVREMQLMSNYYTVEIQKIKVLDG